MRIDDSAIDYETVPLFMEDLENIQTCLDGALLGRPGNTWNMGGADCLLVFSHQDLPAGCPLSRLIFKTLRF